MAERNPPPPEPDYVGRRIDATAMKAFAHPLRMAMYRYLTDHGPATATMLAEHLDESTGQTSYHLRQLARHGFVEEDATRGTARERWWRSVGFSMHGVELAQDGRDRPAVELMLRTQRQHRAEAVRDWFERALHEPAEWVDGSLDNSSTLRLSATQMHELSQDLLRVLHEHATRAQRADPGETARRTVRAYVEVFPLAEDG